jgi:hypothetical protein
MISTRADDVGFLDAPPEFVRSNILNAYPHRHDCLDDLFTAFSDARARRTARPDSTILKAMVEAREDGRRLVIAERESCLTNWFPITHPPPAIRYCQFDGSQAQMSAWLSGCQVPHVSRGHLVGSFAEPAKFSASGPFVLT